MTAEARDRRQSWLLAVPITVLLGAFFAVPLLLVLSLAFRHFDATTMQATGVTLVNFTRFLTDGFYLAVLVRTIAIAIAATMLCVLLGYPVAWHLHTLASSRMRLWLTLIVLLPLMLSLVIASFAWVTILGSGGLVSALLVALGLTDTPATILNTTAGVIIVTTYSHVAYTILSIYAALENIDPGVVRAARIHGASGAQAFLRVILPLSAPGVIAGALIVFALSMAAFVIPYLIGGGRVKVAALLIYQFTMQLFDWSGAAALGVIIFALTAGASWALAAIARRWMPWESRR